MTYKERFDELNNGTLNEDIFMLLFEGIDEVLEKMPVCSLDRLPKDYVCDVGTKFDCPVHGWHFAGDSNDLHWGKKGV